MQELCIVRQAAYKNAPYANIGSEPNGGAGSSAYAGRVAEIREIQDTICATCPGPDHHEETVQAWKPELRHPLKTVPVPVFVWDCSQHVLPSTR
jgi:hypothetical protein